MSPTFYRFALIASWLGLTVRTALTFLLLILLSGLAIFATPAALGVSSLPALEASRYWETSGSSTTNDGSRLPNAKELMVRLALVRHPPLELFFFFFFFGSQLNQQATSST
jgi:hypothetical protein